MDMTLEERIAASNTGQRNNSRRGGRDGGGVRKNTNRAPRGRQQRPSFTEGRSDRYDNGSSWTHDKWEPADDDLDMAEDYPEDNYGRLNDDRGGDDRRATSWRGRGASANPRVGRRERGYKVSITNLHPEVGETDLKTVFSEPGGLRTARILWERDRSTGNAYAIYETYEQAQQAVKQFNTQLAKGQQIYVKYDEGYNAPKRPLESRISYPGRTPSPVRNRSSTSRPAPANIDRYVPGNTPSRVDSGRDRPRPPYRRSDRGDRDSRGGRGDRGERGDRRGGRAPRPKKTKEELDAEIDAYFGKTNENGAATGASEGGAPAPQANDDDVDMEL